MITDVTNVNNLDIMQKNFKKKKEARVSASNGPSKQQREEDSYLYAGKKNLTVLSHYLSRKFTIP